ncbi:MAG: SiaB family protein kinase [Alphaproteobacteria bacterium]
MQASHLFDIRETFDRQQILICFNGPFSRSIIEELGNAVRSYMESQSIAKTAILDVFSVFVEQTQNVRNYLAGKPAAGDGASALDSGTVVIARLDDRYVVTCGNVVEAGDAADLARRLDELAALDRAGLRALYKEQMRRPRSETGGAGLGLIDMARKASAPLEYSVQPIDDRFSFFSLRVAV